MMKTAEKLSALSTPALIIDEGKMMANIARLRDKPELAKVSLRPHLKTAKSVDIALRLVGAPPGPATVSTLKEAEVYFEAGISDLIYAVGISPQKLPRIRALRTAGCDLKTLLDSPEQAKALVAASKAWETPFPALIEIDSDGHRGGLKPGDPLIVEIGRILHSGGLLRGVLTHAGESYNAFGPEAHAEFAERERLAAVTAAQALRDAGLPCPIVSAGSSPTACAIRNTEGLTEVRAGVYVFFDLVMAGIGACRVEDIALSVLATVIGHQRSRGWILVDAGWMALSRDRGTANQPVDQGYGLVGDAQGKVFPDLIVSSVNQEHGIISLRPGSKNALPDLPIGATLRILPNHACATAAQFDSYFVIPEETEAPLRTWPRFSGW
jgi:D-serine deaminase-like pyridoxal phosphate-dependent protein